MNPQHSDAFVFFGATGDLAYKKIFPSLQAMVKRGHLNVPVIGVARSAKDLGELRARARDSLEKHGELDPAAFDKLSNLLDMGLRLNPRDALRGLRNVRFVAYVLLWGFVLSPALVYVITLVIPVENPYAMGLILMGMTPCAPFLPAIVNKAKGDLGFTAAFMLLAAVGTVAFMPFAVPLMVKGLTVSAWTIAKPLLMVVLLPLAVGMVILRASPALASGIQPSIKRITLISTIVMAVLCVIVMIADMDQRAMIMVVLGLPIMVIFALLAVKWFGRSASTDGPGVAPSVPR